MPVPFPHRPGEARPTGQGDVVSPDAVALGARLDENHTPETNGRMAVCRRCGAQTESPIGQRHLPNERRLARSEEWLEKQKRARRIDDARESLKR